MVYLRVIPVVTVFSVFLVLSGCRPKTRLFRKLSADRTGIRFNNLVTENDSINPLDMEFLYNGGGVGVGDFNNDGLPDLYFTGSMVSNKLYINRGNMVFEDVTAAAGVTGEGRWCNGVSVVDINNDGLPDIYVCVSIKSDPRQRTNLLYINQGPDKRGIPVFKEMAREYGLADTGYSVQAAFFDFDNDGDLDMYLLNTKLASRSVDRFSSNGRNDDTTDIDKLYRNDWSDSLGHPVFTNISARAGIIHHGYGLGVAVADLNQDGWEDLYISNDFFASDVLYMNNRDGTFTNRINDRMKHTSLSSMGNDVADLNNDGLPDLMTVDMSPPDNLRKKTNMGAGSYNVYQSMLAGGNTLQYSRNCLQLNEGFVPQDGDTVGGPVFADIGFYAGVAETDWSWNPSLADFDNDGFRDILVTNGYPKDVTDHDFAAVRRSGGVNTSKGDLLRMIPQVRIASYAFRNKGDLRFENVSREWGLETPAFSNGAVYVDLDNDGDLDFVVNNINDQAFVYENTTNSGGRVGANFLDLRLVGCGQNRNGLGASATIYYDHGKLQRGENSPYRGYLSTVDTRLHFGMGSQTLIDSVVVLWPGGARQALKHVAVDTTLVVDCRCAGDTARASGPMPAAASLFSDVTLAKGIHYSHHEDDRNDFSVEKLLPHKFSQYGPALAAADVDGNGLDDLFIGGSQRFPPTLLLQQQDGSFLTRGLLPPPLKTTENFKDMGVLLFDADGDGHPDLYCASGSNEFPAGSPGYRDRFFLNDGKGNFLPDDGAIPVNYTSKSCVKAADFNNDGRPDLFVGGRVLPGSYPMPVSSVIYRNDSRPGHPVFTDVTDSVCPGLKNIGMVTDAIWTDYDNDGWIDLIVVGEWMPVTFFHNNRGRLENRTAGSGVASETGWWNSISAGDFDNDGDIDYVVGNLGLNSFYRASDSFPVQIYAADFDNNSRLDALMSVFLPDEHGRLREFPAQSRDDIAGQLPLLKKAFPSYAAFGRAELRDLVTPVQLRTALHYQVNDLSSVYLENLGQGHFRAYPLPSVAQWAPLYGFVVDDFDQDGNLDLAAVGNDFGNDVVNGRYDALNGLILLGDGKGHFKPQTILQAGVYFPGDAKALVKLAGKNGEYLLAGTQNKDKLRMYRWAYPRAPVHWEAGDRYVLLTLKDGRTRREERYWGSSFLSQSADWFLSGAAVQHVTIYNAGSGMRSLR